MMKDVFADINCVAILGGTFNPVHFGHLAMARYAKEQLPELERVVFMPTATTYYKDGSATLSAEHRLAMLSLAIKDLSYAGLSDMEIKRGGITYTVETMRILHREYPELLIWFIIGADSLFYFDKWYCYEEILSHAGLLIMRRASEKQDMERKAADIKDKAGCGRIPYEGILPDGAGHAYDRKARSVLLRHHQCQIHGRDGKQAG